MSDASTGFRKPSAGEERLIRALIARSHDLRLPPDWLGKLRVKEMEDGGMGSLKLVSSKDERAARSFGNTVAELQFSDADGVEVLVSLNVDKDGEPFELDVWKTDFGAVIRIPENLA